MSEITIILEEMVSILKKKYNLDVCIMTVDEYYGYLGNLALYHEISRSKIISMKSGAANMSPMICLYNGNCVVGYSHLKYPELKDSCISYTLGDVKSIERSCEKFNEFVKEYVHAS